ncbi:Arc family DNA-binding protein [Chromobacterium piscinae]|uniref:Arc family DNA-binding protein n=1 Tax=Chromobacterium piscinae TaxID=686831 RepID=UPI00320AB7ED
MARTDPQVNMRMPAELKDMLQQAASANGRSLNAEIVHRLQGSLELAPSETSESKKAQILLIFEDWCPKLSSGVPRCEEEDFVLFCQLLNSKAPELFDSYDEDSLDVSITPQYLSELCSAWADYAINTESIAFDTKQRLADERRKGELYFGFRKWWQDNQVLESMAISMFVETYNSGRCHQTRGKIASLPKITESFLESLHFVWGSEVPHRLRAHGLQNEWEKSDYQRISEEIAELKTLLLAKASPPEADN